MARHNIIFGNDKELNGGYAGFGGGTQVDDRSQQQYGYGQQTPQPGQQAYGQGAPQGQYGQPGPAANGDPYAVPGQQSPDLEAMYAQPSATAQSSGRMTMRDVFHAVTATFGTIIVVALAVGLLPAVLGAVGGENGRGTGYMLAMGAMILGLIGGLITGLVNAFMRQPIPAVVLLYAVFEGMLLGGISGIMEGVYPGIALQAVLATLAVAGSVLILFRKGVLRTSPRLNKIFYVAMMAYMVFCLVSIGFSVFAGYSLRQGLFGLVIGALAVVMASYCLVMDFEDVQRGIDNGVVRRYAWRCAFGLASTMVWMYLEIIRILAILRGD